MKWHAIAAIRARRWHGTSYPRRSEAERLRGFEERGVRRAIPDPSHFSSQPLSRLASRRLPRRLGLKDGDGISQRHRPHPLTNTVEPSHASIEELEMLFQFPRLDLFSECPSREWFARVRDLEHLEPHALLPLW